MGSTIKKIAWFLLVGSLFVAIVRQSGGYTQIYPWLSKESVKIQHFFTGLDKKYPTSNLKPLKPLPIFNHSATPAPTA